MEKQDQNSNQIEKQDYNSKMTNQMEKQDENSNHMKTEHDSSKQDKIIISNMKENLTNNQLKINVLVKM
jgi:hypothetical protein